MKIVKKIRAREEKRYPLSSCLFKQREKTAEDKMQKNDVGYVQISF